eukprot:TRINITY_DN5376_c0_g2_i3.p1 TRINITY_DN5376_c0_g2~~TRINITY_DN5376_c0_g2_i3.p1  ORF type:complete len:153 (+),score=25.57 TRINITY_DN5376_c0_g2_i3:108-566(+)
MAEGKPIDIMTLNVEQLNDIKQRLEKDLRLLSQSFSQLKMVENKYVEGKECLESIFFDSSVADKELMVPMTSSLYVPGKLADTKRVLVDIGTGYYIEQTVPKTIEYIERRVSSIEENAVKIQQAVETKKKNLETIMFIMQGKMAEHQRSLGK